MAITAFIAVTGRGLERAIQMDAGAWTVEPLPLEADVRCVAVDPLNPATVYAGTATDGLQRSDDRGMTWRSAGLAGQAVRAVAVSPVQSGTVYVGTKPPGLFVSYNGGATWAELEALRARRRWWWFSPAEAPPVPYVQAIALSPEDPDVIIVGIEFGAVLRSSDGGTTWTDHIRGAVRDCHMLAFHPVNGDRVYEGGGTGAAFSQDAGRTWTQPQRIGVRGMLPQLGIRGAPAGPGNRPGLDRFYGWAVAGDPAQPAVWYFSVAPGPQQAHGHDGNAQAAIFRYGFGDGWQRLSGGLPQPLGYMPYALINDIDAPGHLYAGLSNGDVWHATDHGAHWQQLPLHLSAINRTLVALK